MSRKGQNCPVRRAGKSYLDCIREGYASAGFDTAVLDEAVEYSTAHQRQTYELPDEGNPSEQSMM